MNKNSLKGLLLAPVIIFMSSLVLADGTPEVASEPNLPTVTRGQTVTIQGAHLPKQGVTVLLRTGKNPEQAGDKILPLPATVADDASSLTFQLPTEKFNTGRYLVFVAIGSTELAVPGELRVIPDESAKVEIDSVSPTIAYPKPDGSYEFEIAGANLAQIASDNSLEVVGAGLQRFANKPCEPPNLDELQKPCFQPEAGMETRSLVVKRFRPPALSEPLKIRLQVGNNRSEAREITFSRITQAEVRALAVVASLALDLIVLTLIWRGVGKTRIDDENYGPVAAFFLDKETNTYSLSKFQLLAWTAVLVFAYIFVYLCRILIQWKFEFPAIPNGWPTLLGLSAGATVAAVGITVNRGAKGAGQPRPSVADFITSGGLVVSDRFQFFVWTLVGCAAFLGLILTPAPGSLTEVPDVPAGFLYLMGISASGYLAGKLVRAPGPVVSQLLVTNATAAAGAAPATMTITLKGQNLSKDATVKVDDIELRKDQVDLVATKPQGNASDPSFCSEVTVILNEAGNYLEGVHTLTLTNKDGQMAAMPFPVDPLSITKASVAAPAPGAASKTATIQGTNFAAGMTANWVPATGAPSAIPSADITQTSETNLTLNLPAAAAGKGRLVLISAIGLQASADVDAG